MRPDPFSSSPARTAVVLAAGRGARMQAPVSGPSATLPLSALQAERVRAGLKSLIPLNGIPFLAYLLHELAEAGVERVVLVTRPPPDPVLSTLEALAPTRLVLEGAVQSEPLGTAHALLQAEARVAGEPFLVVNADNWFPHAALTTLCAAEGHALLGFRASDLVRLGGIPEARIAQFALLTCHPDGSLAEIVEKPDAPTREAFGVDPLVSMTCWRFEPAIFPVLHALRPSPRGEFELPDAARALVAAGVPVRVVPVRAGVLDLTGPADIAGVEAALSGREVRM